MNSHMANILIETAVRNTLKGIKEAPERSIRNLVDMGLSFSEGRFQQRFLSSVQKMLQNPDSAYYDLVKDIVSYADFDAITHFGINAGYNSCTDGAAIIRRIERTEGFNIPWCLTFFVSPSCGAKRLNTYDRVLTEGAAIGIRTYLLFPEGDPSCLLPLVRRHKDCAFVLFLSSDRMTEELIREIHAIPHLICSVALDASTEKICQRLRKSRMLYGIHKIYDGTEKEAILNGTVLKRMVSSKPLFSFLAADPKCPDATQEEVYRSIFALREAQSYPSLLLDLRYDRLFIDSIISDDAHTAYFDADGFLWADGIPTRECLFEESLKPMLRRRFPKSDAV
ncbi:MAG TPA: hypothetical protein IAB44_08885 [Candidatus Limivivens intestinipullorum]|uniref:Uncharacterized protein n=1 Tax=Candidatus Limivivens intestinipullorum TaxID=2840858 RepID=A0A9D1EU10_9FIRM|nr:hypothetical protein [Candidatus Limivivens intestinipullorum]